MKIAALIDHTYVEPTTSISTIEKICREAVDYHFRAVCIPPLFVKKAKELIGDNNIKIATVVGFPFGYSAIEAKLAETVLAIVDGADEIDLMINIAALKNGDWQYMAREINSIMPLIKAKNKAVKLILETGALNDIEIRTCCDIYGAAGVDAVKTSTGYFENGATVEAVISLRTYLAENITINACGSINSYAFAKKLIEAGAQTISTGNSIEIVKEAKMLE